MLTDTKALTLKALPSDTATVALKLLQIARNRRADWERERDYAKRTGHRPMYCPHGCNQWTDADINCGDCEEYGQDWNYVQELTWAVAEARQIEAKVNKRRAIFSDAVLAGTNGLPVGELIEWVHAGWDQWLTISVRGLMDRDDK